MSDLQCLVCEQPLSAENESDEHVIPNALGGRLRTRLATCQICNSKMGNSIDACLTSSLAPLAAVFDVPRDRGEHPALKVEDTDSRLEYFIKPGGHPELAPNYRYTGRDGNAETSSFYIATEAGARRFVKKTIGKRKRITKLNLTMHEEPGRRFNLVFPPIPLSDPIFLRAVAKIACCFARQIGLPISSGAVAARYFRGESIPSVPVVTTRADVIRIHGIPANSFYHSVQLMRDPDSNRLFAYVCLFYFLEFIVLIDEPHLIGVPLPSYFLNLVTGRPEKHDANWTVNAKELDGWLAEKRLELDRAVSRADRINFWMTNRVNLWANRAAASATEKLEEELRKGVPDEVAEQKWTEEFRRVLWQYGLNADVKLSRSRDLSAPQSPLT